LKTVFHEKENKIIYIVISTGTEESCYKMLELLESKIVVGSFKMPNQYYAEIEIFMHEIDRFFKNKNFL
jgi:hypothetical protein